jgi:nitrite reductase/ring-hydroxylating ferredoxin subunit/uncharacterized membrane protein
MVRLPTSGKTGMVEARAHESVAIPIEQFEALDPIAEPLQKALRAVAPPGSGLKDLLSGTRLGHPLHPPLTDVVIGAWTSALVLDMLGGDDAAHAADLLVAAGALAALPTALAGLSDWAELRGGSRRVGTVHAIGNTTALLLHTLSWAARRRGERRQGRALSAIGYLVVTASAWLGGHLSFSRGVGVNQTAFETAPTEWTAVVDESELEPGKLVGAEVGGVGVLLIRDEGRVHALADRCSHRGCALHEGEFVNDHIVCPCHGSTFRLDGSIVRGPATAPQPVFDVRAREGKVEIRASS